MEQGPIARDGMNGVEETKKMIKPSKDEITMDQRMDENDGEESREASKKEGKGEEQEQKLTLIFSQQVTA